MASKTSLRIVPASTESSQPKQQAEAQAHLQAVETAEELRRRKAGIACFL